MLHTKAPREQSGRDSLSRYRAQIRSAAMAALSILEGKETDRVYCDLHDDFVVRKVNNSSYRYLFYQVKTKEKQNHNWTLDEVFGLKSTIKDQSKQDTAKIKDSFVGKLLLHTVVFEACCDAIIFQTNINNNDDVAALLNDITSGAFSNKFTKVLLERFNALFSDQFPTALTLHKVKEYLSKLEFQTDVQHLKEGEENFAPQARAKIYQYSEVDLSFEEANEILLKLLGLVAKKSSGKIKELTAESIEELAGISINDLLSILSISKEAYLCLIQGGDSKAIKNASIIQRTLLSAGATMDHVKFCSQCKSDWDNWLRNNRHTLPELDLHTITSMLSTKLNCMISQNNMISMPSLRIAIKDIISDLESNGLKYDLEENLILGGIFSEIVRAKS